MTSFQSLGALRSTKSSEKMSRGRHKVVKPILKKWSHSEKNSLDLDRGWSAQNEQYQNTGVYGGASSFYESGSAIRSGSTRDVSFAPVSEAAEPESGSGGRRFNHTRSISGTSHVSVATSGSGSGVGPRSGATFVHPFQQMPRTATPPLSYANSLVSFADGRDYSPAITEGDDYDFDPLDPTASHNSLHHHNSSPSQHTNSYSHSQPSLTSSNIRRPSLASQRTNSFSDIPSQHPQLRINTAPRAISTTPAQSSRLAHVSSRSDLNLDSAVDSPSSMSVPQSNHHFGSPSSTVGPMTPFSRSSFEAASFPRLRAKSDLDTATRAEHLREARRKFEAREQAKEEKYAREEIKKRERAENKRAQELERQAAAIRKERDAEKLRQDAAALADAMPRNSKHSRKISTASSGRPSTSRKTAPSLAGLSEPEKFVSSNYDTLESRPTPVFGNEAGGAYSVVFEPAKRGKAAKRKTHGAWTTFILWLRTRLLRMNSKER